MPLEFQVLRCVNCEKFQVHQTKKAKKWICKVCGEKQSYLRIYFTGSAPQCRSIVQENNFKAGEIRTAKILAESPNYFPENTGIEEEFEDEKDFFNPASKKLKSEIESSVATKDFHLDSACFLEKDNSIFDESCPISECYKQNDRDEEEPLMSTGRNPKMLLPYTVANTCEESGSSLKPEVCKTKPHFAKNRGFHMILKAAEKFS